MAGQALLEMLLSELEAGEAARLAPVLLSGMTRNRRARTLERVLDGEGGYALRVKMGRMLEKSASGGATVPEIYAKWRPLVRDAMGRVFRAYRAADLPRS